MFNNFVLTIWTRSVLSHLYFLYLNQRNTKVHNYLICTVWVSCMILQFSVSQDYTFISFISCNHLVFMATVYYVQFDFVWVYVFNDCFILDSTLCPLFCIQLSFYWRTAFSMSPCCYLARFVFKNSQCVQTNIL